jgi:hypothetical protein
MWFHSALAFWSSPAARKRRPQRSPKPQPGFRPRLEALEDRCVPSTLIVTINADNGASGTLRWAVTQAQSDDTIDVLTAKPIVLTQGELYLGQSLTIEATAGRPATISGGGNSRVFEVAAGAVSVDNLIITGGNGVSVNPSNSGGLDTLGGGILNEGQLTLNNCTLSGNFAAWRGGGIANTSGGALTVNSCTLSGNSAGNGGGIDNEGGAMTVNSCTLSGNSATYGGGISNGYNGSGPLATVGNSTLSGNSATFGGGIVSSQSLAVTNSTLSNNTARLDGGGAYNEGYLTVNNCTLSGNFAGRGGGGIFTGASLFVTSSTLSSNSAGYGGGIANRRSMTVTNSTLSGNTATSNGGGIWTNGSYNVHQRPLPALVTISNCTLSGNSATHGGAIYNGGVLSTLHVGGSAFLRNTVDNIFGTYIDDGGNTGL